MQKAGNSKDPDHFLSLGGKEASTLPLGQMSHSFQNSEVRLLNRPGIQSKQVPSLYCWPRSHPIVGALVGTGVG